MADNEVLIQEIPELLNGLISHYKLNEDAANTTVKDSIGSNAGTLQGGDDTEDLSEAGKINNCLHFNGSDDYVDCGTATNCGFTTEDFSISCWIKLDTLPGTEQVLISRGVQDTDGWYLGVGSNDDIYAHIRTTTSTTVYLWTDSFTFSTGTWYHVVFTRADNTYKCYINNDDKTLSSSGSLSAINYNASTHLSLGRQSEGSNYFDGYIDDVRIYDRVLSPNEVSHLYNSGNGTEGYYTGGISSLDILANIPITDTSISIEKILGLYTKLITDTGTNVDEIAVIVNQLISETALGTSALLYDALLNILESLSGVDSVDVEGGKRVVESVVGTDSITTTGINSILETLTSIESLLIESDTSLDDTSSATDIINILAMLPTLTDTCEGNSRLSVVARFPDVGKLIYPVLKVPEFYDSDIIQYVGGTEQRRLGVGLPQYKITLRFASLTESEKDEILILFNFTQGKRKTFLWIDPITSDRHYVRFFEDSLNFNYFYYQLYNLNEVVLLETDIDWEI
jgi:hypothetical protein